MRPVDTSCCQFHQGPSQRELPPSRDWAIRGDSTTVKMGKSFFSGWFRICHTKITVSSLSKPEASIHRSWFLINRAFLQQHPRASFRAPTSWWALQPHGPSRLILLTRWPTFKIGLTKRRFHMQLPKTQLIKTHPEEGKGSKLFKNLVIDLEPICEVFLQGIKFTSLQNHTCLSHSGYCVCKTISKRRKKKKDWGL